MRASENSEKRVMVILADNTALCFSPIESKTIEPKTKGKPRPPSAGARRRRLRLKRVAAFLKSFLPRVSRVSPVEAVLQSGQRLKLIAPPGVH